MAPQPGPASASAHLALIASVLLMMLPLLALFGAGLGLFLGGLALASLLLPFVLPPSASPGRTLLSAGSALVPVALVWLCPVLSSPAISFPHWLGACALLLAIALLQSAFLVTFLRLGLLRPSAAGLTALCTLLWHAAPVWLIPNLQTPALLPWMHRFIAIHPLFALNALIPHPVWTELPIAYTLSNLNQDVPYTLPSSPLPAILVHALPAIVLLLIQIKAANRTLRY